jgi:hypothetical protein
MNRKRHESIRVLYAIIYRAAVVALAPDAGLVVWGVVIAECGGRECNAEDCTVNMEVVTKYRRHTLVRGTQWSGQKKVGRDEAHNGEATAGFILVAVGTVDSV